MGIGYNSDNRRGGRGSLGLMWPMELLVPEQRFVQLKYCLVLLRQLVDIHLWKGEKQHYSHSTWYSCLIHQHFLVDLQIPPHI